MSQTSDSEPVAGPATTGSIKTCTVCGKPFTLGPGDTARRLVCSPECVRERQRAYAAVANAKAAQKRREGRQGNGVAPAPARTDFPRVLLPDDDEDEELPAPPALLGPVPGVPWASPALCAAVRVGAEAMPARKIGVFMVTRDGQAYRTHVPSRENGRPHGTVVLVARLTPRGRWALRTPARDTA